MVSWSLATAVQWWWNTWNYLFANKWCCLSCPVNQSAFLACLCSISCRMSLKNRDSVNTVPTAQVLSLVHSDYKIGDHTPRCCREVTKCHKSSKGKTDLLHRASHKPALATVTYRARHVLARRSAFANAMFVHTPEEQFPGSCRLYVEKRKKSQVARTYMIYIYR